MEMRQLSGFDADMNTFTVYAIMIENSKKVLRIMPVKASTEIQALEMVRQNLFGKKFVRVDLIDKFEIENLI